jgi:hypothetical protein
MISNEVKRNFDELKADYSANIQRKAWQILETGAYTWDGTTAIFRSQHLADTVYSVNGHGCQCQGYTAWGKCYHSLVKAVLAVVTPAAPAIEVEELDVYENDGEPFDARRNYQAETAARRQSNADRWRIAGKHARSNRFNDVLSDIDRLEWTDW